MVHFSCIYKTPPTPSASGSLKTDLFNYSLTLIVTVCYRKSLFVWQTQTRSVALWKYLISISFSFPVLIYPSSPGDAISFIPSWVTVIGETKWYGWHVCAHTHTYMTSLTWALCVLTPHSEDSVTEIKGSCSGSLWAYYADVHGSLQASV